METSINAVISAYEIHYEKTFSSENALEWYISVKARLETPNGEHIGSVDTDIYDFAPNLPVALYKAFRMHRQIDKNKIIPNINL